MMDARKFLINLLYRATAQSSEVPGWSHRQTKNFHWHVSGPYFRDYHLILDEQAAEILAVTDAIAERARKTGNTTIRSIGDIARHQTTRRR